MKKRLTTILSLLLMLSTSLQAQDFESATDAVKNMGVGWNLGNTLDAVDWTGTDGWNWASVEDHEKGWEQPVTQPELLKMMKEAGFGAIRVPVTWFQEMDANGKVNEAWMKRVHEVVDYVIDNGMYCLLNVHHDTGDHNLHWLVADQSVYDNVKDKYEYLWEQIATEFKDYDQHLLFEAYNEMLDSKNTWNEPSNKTDGYQAINNYAKSFVSAVRATGGNNAQRNLVINTYSASNSPNAMKALELPEESGHIAFEIHNYPDWQSESHARELVDYLIDIVKTNLISKGAPVIIGEYSTLSVWPERDWYYENRNVALYAMDYFIKKTKEEGIATFYWMGLSDGVSRSYPAFNQPDIAETITKAYHGDAFQGVYPAAEMPSDGAIFEGEKLLEWGEAINMQAALFSELSKTSTLEITYTQKYDQFTGNDAYGMFQFWYNDWSEKIDIIVDGTTYNSDFVPLDVYGTESGTDHVTTFSFDEETFKNIKKKGMLFQGHGIVVKKVVLIAGEPETHEGEEVFWEGDEVLDWGGGLQLIVPAEKFEPYGKDVQLVLSYTMDFSDYDDLQLFYSDWDQENDVVFSVDGKEYTKDFSPSSHYGVGTGEALTTAMSFKEDVLNLILTKGIVLQGHGMRLNKVALSKSSGTSIKGVTSSLTDNPNAPLYNLAGQRVTNPKKGIYIKNGKKFIVK